MYDRKNRRTFAVKRRRQYKYQKGRILWQHLIDKVNMNYIMECSEKSDIIIFATGTDGDGNKTVLLMQKQLLDMLKPFRNKQNCITDARGRKFYHPLCPAVYS